ncbi:MULTISPECIES: hypothetical protein [Nostoc]|uniref:Uncharacterized protein n=1 Tax=Nostoc paludosum FACHB-159 TaxID=2692908 RepID=A0ABR8KLG2_9NOSO|nr:MULTISPECIES: hypothetical protein [Nostoc]MBD2682545.1 hypothetical protein [Nostoc sp. FACHB-857]MBD2738877.1 hypothetical protein [Nostoc paludosum FACHB-159]
MLSPGFHQRLQDLEDHIAQEQELLREFEEVLRYEPNPRIKAGYRRDIERQQESVAGYRQEYNELQHELTGQSSARMQEMGNQLQQMDAKLNILLSSQVAIYENLDQMRQDLLLRYDANEQATIEAVAKQLNQNQLVLTQNLLDALEANQVSEQQMQQMLAVLEERVSALPPSQAAVAEIIKAPELDAKHKLKVTLPLVPFLVDYEGELELGSGFNIKTAWEQLLTKLRRK